MKRRVSKHRVTSTQEGPGVLRLVSKAKIVKNQEAEAARRAVDLKIMGFSIMEIATEMARHSAEIPSLLLNGLQEYYASRDEELQKYAALSEARYDFLFKTWLPLAQGYTEKVTDEDGDTIEIVHPPSPEATRIILTAMRDAAKMHGLNKTRVEITGKNGEAIKVKADLWNGLNESQLQQILEGDNSPLLGLGGGAANSQSSLGARQNRAGQKA